jgi:hypothetical protein
MQALNLECFLPPIEDKELNQYKILAKLKEYSEQLHKNKLYPSFAQLNLINNFLDSLLAKYRNVTITNLSKIKSSSIKSSEVNIVNDSKSSEDTLEMIEIIKWAKSLVGKLLDEGLAIYDFVSENMSVEIVEPEPSYKDEGYIIIPDYENSQLLLVEYISSIFNSNNKPVRSLKTRLLTQINIEFNETSITELGLNLIYKYGNLVNPAVFICKTELDFPFKETLFPIIKSKLLAQLTKHSTKRYFM